MYGRTLVAVYESTADAGVGCSWDDVLQGERAALDEAKRKIRRGGRGRKRGLGGPGGAGGASAAAGTGEPAAAAGGVQSAR